MLRVNESRLHSVVDYLRELHALRFPPVRNVRSYSDFRLEASRIAEEVPGLHFDPNGPAWLTIDLPTPPPEPDPPADLSDALTPRLLPLARPLLRTDLELASDKREEITRKYLEWMASGWEPWEEGYRRCEAGRQLYRELFSAYDRLDADRDSVELVWGFGRVRWKTFDIDHPLVVIPMEIGYDARAARLSVIQSGPAQVANGFVAGISLVAAEQLSDACASLEAAGFDPWAPGVTEQELTPLLRMMSNDPPAEGGPSLDDGWLLYLRRRPSGYLDFLKSLDDNLDSLAALPPLAALVSADPRQVEASGFPSGSAAASHLLPLPANEEQRQILRFATSAAGVTVEGPPGTGKSHTIANLICAFIAQGKRVLVTAEKEQALNVLIDKLPESVRSLCVPVLGSGQQERLRLEHSIDRISQSAFGLAHYGPADISRLRNELDEVQRAEATALNELRHQRDIERSPLPTRAPQEAGATLIELAAWLHGNEAALGYIPDAIRPETDCPLGPSEVDELAVLIADIPESDMTAALRTLPSAEMLPESVALIARTSERRELVSIFDEGQGDTHPVALPDVDLAELRAIEAQLRSGAERIRLWAGSWQGRLEHTLRDRAALSMWRSFADQLARGRDTAMALRAQVQLHDIEMLRAEGFDQNETAELGAAQERLRRKRRLGIWQRTGRRLLDQCRVDGQVPRTAEHVGLLLAASELVRSRTLLANLLASEYEAFDLPTEPLDRPEEVASTLLPNLESVLEWHSVLWPALRDRTAAAEPTVPAEPDPEGLDRLADAIRATASGLRVRELDDERERLLVYLRTLPRPDSSPLWQDLARAFESEDWVAWASALAEVRRLNALADRAERLRSLLDRINAVAPEWTTSARTSGGTSLRSGLLLTDAWQWRQLATWLEQTTAGRDSALLEADVRSLAEQKSHLVAELVAAQAWTAVIERIDGPTQTALGAYKQANARARQRFSKFAPMYQRQVQAALEECRHAVPVWIMPVERALSDFRCQKTPPFDVLIVDEASQIPITRLPVLGLAHKVIVVGDDKQISPSTPGLELQPIFDLIRTHLADVPKADTTFHPNSSLYDAALTHFPRQVKLTEHFRSLTEIISFSNGRYYGDALVPLRDQLPSPGWVPTHSVLIADGYRDDDDCNRPEAEYAAALIGALIKRPEYAGKSFGVISLLGKSQSKLIHDLLFDGLGPVVMAERHIRVGEPAVLQGDERDVVVVSTVVSDAGGRRFGAMTRRDHQQMINVAASRARDQLWVLHSVPADAFAANDERAALIRHCTQVRNASTTFTHLRALADPRSPFEWDVLRALVDRGYRAIRPQHRVGRYLIDFVIDGPHSRLALECDGERFHGPEQWDADRARQDVLERAGWTFVRLRGSKFYRDPAIALRPLWEKLDELGIPTGDWSTKTVPVELNLDPSTARRVPAPTDEPPAVAVRDTAVAPVPDAPSVAAAQASSGDAWGAAFSAADEALRRRTDLTDKLDSPLPD